MTKELQQIKVGCRVKFEEEKQSYKVQACNDKFAICNKPFNPRRTVLYTIIDFENKIRGPENLIFGAGAETKEQCEEMLKRLTNGETEVSYRNNIPLKIEFVKETGESK